MPALFIPALLVGALLLTPLLTIIAGWLPAVQAASQDPTQVLHET
jgi:ABC-type lipoprotein release transport system permease subunit